MSENTLTATPATRICPDGPQTLTAPDALALAMQEAIEADYAAMPQTFDPRTNLANWYLGKIHDIESRRALIKEQAAVMLRQLDAAEQFLRWRRGAEFKSIVDAMLHSQGGRKKSVDFLTGRAGYRKKAGKVQIIDDAALIEWCKLNCQAAIELKIARTTPIKDHIESTGEEVPGARYIVPDEAFYPPINQSELSQTVVPIIGSELSQTVVPIIGDVE